MATAVSSLFGESDAFKLKQELQQREQEVIGLREMALQRLEAQLEAKGKELTTVAEHMEILKRDFHYNLGLLEERDAELERFENEHALLSAMISEKELQLAQVQKQLTEAQAEVRMEQVKRTESESIHHSMRSELQQALEDERAAHAKSMQKLREEGEAVARALQRALYESEEASQRQRREMGAEFELKLQEAQASCKMEIERALEEAESSRILAQQRAEEVALVRQKEMEKMSEREDTLARLRESEKLSRSLSMELELTRARAASSEEEMRETRKAAKLALDEKDLRMDQISLQLTTAQSQMEMLLSESSNALAKIQVQAKESEALWRVKLEQAQVRCDAAEEQASQLQTSLRSLKRDMQARVSELEQELRLVKEASEMALSDYERKQGREMRELKEQLQAGDSELLAMRGNILELSRALEERKREVDGCRESLREASEREARLQMDLIACQQQQQQQGKAPPPVVPSSGHGEQLVTKLMEQRDAAKAALEEAQSRLLDKETEIGQLRDVLAQLSPRRIGGVPSVLAAVAGASKPSSSHLKPRDRFRGLSVQLPHPFPGNSSSPASVPPLALESSVDSLPDLSSLQQAFMALVPSPTTSTVAPARSRPQPPGGSGAHNPVDGSSRYPGSLPEHNLPLSSEEDETMIPSPSSSSPNVNFEPKSFRQHFASDGIHPVGPRGDLEVLLRPFAESLLQQFQAQAQNGQELDHLREAARQLGEENIRLKSTLAIMRNEMEALSGQRQQQQQGPEEGDEHSLRHSISLLRAELEESDKDVLQAMQHVHVLQRQLSAVALHNNSSEESTSAGIRQQDDLTLAAGGETELSFLRTRAHDLSMENRSLRRRLLQSRLLPPPGNLPNESRERDRPENDDLSPVPSFVMTRPSPLPVGSVEGGDLDAELDEARQTVARVSAENGRLMELSNSLRAERDRLLHLVSALTARELSAGESDEFESEIEEVTLKANLSRPRPHVAHLSQSSLAISNQDQPETSDSVSFLPQPNQDSPPPHSPDAPFSFQSLEPSQLFTPLPTSQHTKSKSLPSASSKEPRDPIAALNAVAIARAQHHRQQSAASDEGSITNQVNLHIGAISPSSRLPSAVPGSASSRETASQRSKLLALQRRKEVEARQVELDEMRPQVRNYNIKDNVE